LSGALFLLRESKAKKAGTEGGKVAQNFKILISKIIYYEIVCDSILQLKTNKKYSK